MAKRGFNVGDRVVVYGGLIHTHGNVTDLIAEVVCVYPEALQVAFVDPVPGKTVTERSFTVHKKQCRRLIRKERRRVWVEFDDRGDLYNCHKVNDLDGYPVPQGHTVREFVEARKK